jgi:hypothetical protein
VSVPQIGKQYRLTDKAVVKVLEKLLPTLDVATRARYLRESLGTLDMLQAWWTGQARTSAVAAGLVLKIQERRSALLGLDMPVRLDLQVLQAGDRPQEGSTEALLEQLHRIARERPSGLRRIEAALDAGVEPSPDPPAA